MNSPRQALQDADNHDLAGRHDQALVALAAAVRAGDAEGMSRLGKRLLVGDRAPLLPPDGTGLLLEAAQKGDPEAPAILAVLAGLGLYVPQNWQVALQQLQVAASRGWLPAQGQLQVLGGSAGMAPDDWPAMTRNVDIGLWLQVPEAHTLHQSPLVRSFPAFASAAVCQWLVRRSEPRLQRALVYDALTKETMANHTRTNSAVSFSLADTDLVTVLVQARMAACTGMPFNHLEAATVLHYAEGQQITEHFDFVDPNVPDYPEQIRTSGQRIITFLVYLNDGYAGGETAFPRLGITHKGQPGEGLFFVNALADGSADVRTLHAGRPPIGGEKWIVSQFIRNRRVL